MLRGGGQLDGVRLLGPRTVAAMTRNWLPGNADLDTYGRALFAETPYTGVGFGLGFGVVLDPVGRRAAHLGRRLLVGRRREHLVLGGPRRGPHLSCS